MASGVYNRLSLSAATWTTLVPTTGVTAGKTGIITVNVSNTNGTSVSIRMAISANQSPSAGEYIEYNTVLGGYGVLEKTGIVLTNGLQITCYCDTANVSFVAYGLEN